MTYTVKAACLSNSGKRRKNNEDNFYFNGQYLPADKTDMTAPYEMTTNTEKAFVVSVFDGMGGESYGEFASFEATQKRAELEKNRTPETDHAQYMKDTAATLNEAVVGRAKELLVRNMGSTLVELLFDKDKLLVSNMGDSRAFVLRGGVLTQLSVDHCDERLARTKKDGTKSKAPLTRYLGVDSEEYAVEPEVSEHVLKEGDVYLICSDGVTDMIDVEEITSILLENPEPSQCVAKLVEASLEAGGKDNITAIVSRIEKPTAVAINHMPGNEKAKKPTLPLVCAAIGVIALMIAAALLFNPKCKHEFMPATCTDPQICSKCGEQQGEALGHDYQPVTCISPATCRRCGESTGKPLGHDYSPASCTQPATCKICGDTKGECAEHDWEFVSQSTKECKECGYTEAAEENEAEELLEETDGPEEPVDIEEPEHTEEDGAERLE